MEIKDVDEAGRKKEGTMLHSESYVHLSTALKFVLRAPVLLVFNLSSSTGDQNQVG